MDVQLSVEPGQSYFEALIDALRKKDAKRNRFAAEILHRLGGKAVSLLIEEAASDNKRPDHRLRILDIVIDIGEPLRPAEYQQVYYLQGHTVARVRDKAAEVLERLHPDGPPPLVPPEVTRAIMEHMHPANAMRRVEKLGRRHRQRQQSRSAGRRPRGGTSARLSVGNSPR